MVVPGSSITPPSPLTCALSTGLGSNSMFGSMLGFCGSSSRPKRSPVVGKRGTAPHSSLFKPYIPSWAITRESLQSEDTTTKEWRESAHPPSTMEFLMGQLGARVADNLRYAAAQASILLVAVANLICRFRVTEA
ncbi:unnamed protein product [Lactuca saligna]|uniref:Uncharacterized protein n=1 Tax=Lactuca saligna TaxID=75948 RepID=A0AA36E8W7_LACSI|nr:unnamed protein product [Lactuca saligna]